jgi:hypothetical protein
VTFYDCDDRTDGPFRVIVAEITPTRWNAGLRCVLAVEKIRALRPDSPYLFAFVILSRLPVPAD